MRRWRGDLGKDVVGGSGGLQSAESAEGKDNRHANRLATTHRGNEHHFIPILQDRIARDEL